MMTLKFVFVQGTKSCKIQRELAFVSVCTPPKLSMSLGRLALAKGDFGLLEAGLGLSEAGLGN